MIFFNTFSFAQSENERKGLLIFSKMLFTRTDGETFQRIDVTSFSFSLSIGGSEPLAGKELLNFVW